MYRVRLKSPYNGLEWLYGSPTGLYDIEEKIMFVKVMFYVNSTFLIIASMIHLDLKGDVKELVAERDSYKQLIAECEKDIPRNKTCKLVAVDGSE